MATSPLSLKSAHLSPQAARAEAQSRSVQPVKAVLKMPPLKVAESRSRQSADLKAMLDLLQAITWQPKSLKRAAKLIESDIYFNTTNIDSFKRKIINVLTLASFSTKRSTPLRRHSPKSVQNDLSVLTLNIFGSSVPLQSETDQEEDIRTSEG